MIETPRLILRDFAPADFDAFYATTQDPAYREFYPEEEMSRPAMQKVFERILARTAQQPRVTYQLAVCLKTGELIGTCGVRSEDSGHSQASFGAAFGQAYWGQGYAYEASFHLIDFAFKTLPIHRLYAETLNDNRPARALAERLGMRLEGQMREIKFFRGRWWDGAIYAILRQEWEGLHG